MSQRNRADGLDGARRVVRRQVVAIACLAIATGAAFVAAYLVTSHRRWAECRLLEGGRLVRRVVKTRPPQGKERLEAAESIRSRSLKLGRAVEQVQAEIAARMGERLVFDGRLEEYAHEDDLPAFGEKKEIETA